MIQHCKALGLDVVTLSPLNRSGGGSGVQHPDGIHTLANFQYWIEAVSLEQGAKVIQGGTAPLAAEHFADGLHLNALGHDAFCTWLIQKMRALGFWTSI